MSLSTSMGLSNSLIFVEDFDASDVIPKSLMKTEGSIFTQEELNTLQKISWDEGFSAGATASIGKKEDATTECLVSISRELATARADVLAQGRQLAEGIVGFLLTVLGSVLPALSAQYGPEEIEIVTQKILPMLLHDQPVQIQVAPERMNDLRKAVSGYAEDLQQNIRMTASDRLGGSDVIIRWQYGEAVRDINVQWHRILDILAPLGISKSSSFTENFEKANLDVK